jgi:hypothetical protein
VEDRGELQATPALPHCASNKIFLGKVKVKVFRYNPDVALGVPGG